MDIFDQTQGLDVLNATMESDTDDEGHDKRVVGNLKVLSQRGFPETDYPVYLGENVIGRSIEECQIHIPIKVLSKRHAVIEVDKDVHMVYDCESHNKSYKGSLLLRPMVRYEIRDGEILKFGDVRCMYSKSCLVSVDDEDSQSDTATESILTGPNRSKDQEMGKKVLAESIDRDVKSFVPPDVSFELKSDSESSEGDDDCVIPSSQNDTTFVPETPANFLKTTDRKQLSLVDSVKKPIIVSDSESDTDIENATNTLIDAIEAPTQAYPTDSEYYEKKKQLSKASLSKKEDSRKTDSEIDWSDLETQPYIKCAADIPDEEIMNMETQIYPVETSDRNECNTSEEDIAFAETIPVSVVEIASKSPPNITKTNKGESEASNSQSSDNEFRAVQKTVMEVLQSSALVLSPQTPKGKKQTHLGDGSSKLSPVADVDVACDKNTSDSSSETRIGSQSKLRLSQDDESFAPFDKTEEQIKSPSKTKGRKKSAKQSPVVVSLEDVEVDNCSMSRKGGRGKRKSDEKNVDESDVIEDSPAKKCKAGAGLLKDKGVAHLLLPEPVVPNPALNSSPKTYSRKERSKEYANLESEASAVNEEAVFVQSVNDDVDDNLVVEFTTAAKRKEQNLSFDKVLGNSKVELEDEKSNDSIKRNVEDQTTHVEHASASSRGKRKKAVPLLTDSIVEDTLELSAVSEITLKVPTPVKIPSTPNTPFRRVGRRLHTKSSSDEDVFEDTHRSSNSKKSKRLKKSNENASNTEIRSPLRSTRSRQNRNALASTPRSNVDGMEEPKMIQTKGLSANKVSPAVTSREKETPKPSRGRPKRKSSSGVGEKSPEINEQPVDSMRTPSKRGPKKDISQEEVASKVKAVKGSKKQKVANVEVNECKSSQDVSDEEEVEVKSSRTRSTARNTTITKRGQKKDEPQEEAAPKVKALKSSKKKNVSNGVVSHSESSLNESDNDEEEDDKVEVKSSRSRSTARNAILSKNGQKKETPKPSRGRPKRKSSSGVGEKSPEMNEQPVASMRTPSKRAPKKDESKEEVASKVKVLKESKKQKVAIVDVTAPKSDDETQHASVDEEAKIKSSRSHSTGRNKSPTKVNLNSVSTSDAIGPVGKTRRGRPANSSLSDDRSPKSPRLRMNQPTIMFTGISDAAYKKTIDHLGGTVTESVFECTHLVTDKIRRTCKLLCTVARGKPVVSVDWLTNSEESNLFVDPWPFLINDKTSEKQFRFSLSKSLTQAAKKKLLHGYCVHVTRSVKPDPEQMKPIIECAGGTFLSKMPRKTTEGTTTVVVSCIEDLKLCSSANKTDIPIVGVEFMLTGILRQQVDIKSNLLCDGEVSSPISNKRGTPKRGKVAS